MEPIKKWYAAPEGSPPFEIPVESYEEAISYMKHNFKGSGEVRVLQIIFKQATTTPFIVNTGTDHA